MNVVSRVKCKLLLQAQFTKDKEVIIYDHDHDFITVENVVFHKSRQEITQILAKALGVTTDDVSYVGSLSRFEGEIRGERYLFSIEADKDLDGEEYLRCIYTAEYKCNE